MPQVRPPERTLACPLRVTAYTLASLPPPGSMRLLVSCGEPSGDLYGAQLVRHLRRELPELTVFGLGGDRLLAEGARLTAHVRELAVVGLVEVIRHLSRLRAVFRALVAEILRDPPQLAV